MSESRHTPLVALPFTVEPWVHGVRDDSAVAGFNDYERAKTYAESIAGDYSAVTITETVGGVPALPEA